MKPLKPRSKKGIAVLAAVAVMLSLALTLSGIGEFLNYQGQDVMFSVRGAENPPDDVVIVAIDEPSFANIGLQWPWPRELHGHLIQALSAAGARTIAMDIVFAEPSDPTGDNHFAQALAGQGNAVMAADVQQLDDATYVQRIVVKPLPDLVGGGVETGIVTLPLDRDGTIRRTHLTSDGLPAFSLLAAAKHGANAGDLADPSLINFYGPPRQVKTVSYYQALAPDEFLPPGFFKDKLVFIGLSVQSAVDAQSFRADYFPIPFSRFQGGYMAGVEIHATFAANLIDGRILRAVPRAIPLIAGFVVAFVIFAVFGRLRPPVTLAGVGGYLAAVAGGGYALFVTGSQVVGLMDLAGPPVMFTAILSGEHYFRTLREKLFIRGLFATYLAPAIVEQLEQNPARLELSGEEIEASVMFLDIAGFTTLSEKLSPVDLLDLLNSILGQVSDIVIRNDGLVDKYIGDAVMAVWGVPLTQPNHAANACRAGLEIRDAIDALNRSGTLIAPIGFRIGINSGILVAGNMGGEQHRNYSVLGDTVNLASRIEGVNNQYGTRIAISEFTAAMIGDGFDLRGLDKVAVKGKQKPVGIVELQGLSGSRDDTTEQMSTLYAAALKNYQAGDWQKAADIFARCLDIDPNDVASQVLRDRCRRLQETPPEEAWDGVFRMRTK